MSSDDAPLFDRAALVVEGEIVQIDEGREGRYFTDYRLAVGRVLKGASGGTVRVAVLGGGPSQGVRLEIPDAPTFRIGEQLLLFLGPERQDGSRRLWQFGAGAFRRIQGLGRSFAIQQLRGAAAGVGGFTPLPAVSDSVRDWDAFGRWLLDRGQGKVRAADYRVAPSDLERQLVLDAYTFLDSNSGHKARWFEFDRGRSVTYFANELGQDGTDFDEFAALQRAIAAWDNDTTSKIDLRYGGTVPNTATTTQDNRNTIVWNDPNDDIEGTFRCFRGGTQTIAIGGFFYTFSTSTFTNGDGASEQGHEIREAYIAVNDGAGCFLDGHQSKDGEEVLAHEVGHTIGLGHSTVSDALMRATAHADGRGALLSSDEIAAVAYLYPEEPGAFSSFRFDKTFIIANEGGEVAVAVRRDGSSGGSGSVRVVSVSGAATSGVDFTPVDTVLHWDSGQFGVMYVTVTTLADGIDEGYESFELHLQDASGGSLGADATATVSIREGVGGMLTFTTAGASVGESVGSVTLSVQREGGTTGAVGVPYSTVAGSALAGSDFVTTSGTLQWTNGEDGAKTIAVPIINDGVGEATETFSVVLGSPTGGAALGAISQFDITVVDDDTPGTLRFGAPLGEISEGGGTLQLPVERVDGKTGAISVHFATSNLTATAGSDYAATSGTLQWPNGDTAPRSIPITILQDTVVEGQERFRVSLSSPEGGAILAAPASIDVLIDEDDDAGRFELTVSQLEVSELDTMARVAVRRSGGTVGAVSVRLATSDGTAHSGSDYSQTMGTLQWAAGAGGTRFFDVPLMQDAVAERVETFLVSMDQPTGGAVITDPAQATVSIVDPSHPGEIQFTQASLVGVEGSSVLVSVERVGGLHGAVSTGFGATGGDAQVGTDLAALGGEELSWGDGEGGVRSFELPLLQDTASETLESLQLTLEGLTGGAVVGALSTMDLLIRDDDPALLQFHKLAGAGSGGPQVARGADGRVFLASESGVGSQHMVMTQTFDADGQQLTAASQVHASSPSGGQRLPRVAPFGSGFLAAWLDEDAGHDHLRVRRFSAAGQPLGDASLLVDSALAIDDFSLGTSQQGGAVVLRRVGTIELLFFDTKAKPKGALQAIGQGDLPHVALSGLGNGVAVWRSQDGLRRRLLSAGNTLVGGQALVVADPAVSAFDVAAWGSREYAIAWQGGVAPVLRRFSDSGPIGQLLSLTLGATRSETADDLALSVNANGDLAVAWSNSRREAIWFNALSADGQLFTRVIEVSPQDASPAVNADVVMGEDGNSVVVWQRQTGSQTSQGIESRLVGAGLAAGSCGDALCLGDGRFAVRAHWTKQDDLGDGVPVELSRDTGYFWFFMPSNVEVVVKTLDGCSFNGNFWVFAGGLTNVGVEIVVTDVQTGYSSVQRNPIGTAYQLVSDIGALPTCDP